MDIFNLLPAAPPRLFQLASSTSSIVVIERPERCASSFLPRMSSFDLECLFIFFFFSFLPKVRSFFLSNNNSTTLVYLSVDRDQEQETRLTLS